jgi:hypothetical protein
MSSIELTEEQITSIFSEWYNKVRADYKDHPNVLQMFPEDNDVWATKTFLEIANRLKENSSTSEE